MERKKPYLAAHHNFIYDGYWKGSVPEGHGKILFQNGEYFEGEFKKGIADGQGVYIFENGDYFEGEI